MALALIPRIAEDVNRTRIEKPHQTSALKVDGECLANSPNTRNEPEAPVCSRIIAASVLYVNGSYPLHGHHAGRNSFVSI